MMISIHRALAELHLYLGQRSLLDLELSMIASYVAVRGPLTRGMS